MGRKGGIGGAVSKAAGAAGKKRRGRVTGGKKQEKDIGGAIGSFLQQLAQRGGRQQQRMPIPTRNLGAPAGGARPTSRRGSWDSLFGMGR